MYPHERSLVKRLAGRPFALLGVNSDRDLAKLRPRLQAEKITWRSFWNGPAGTHGPIATRFNVETWPTLYLIDHEGIIRHRWLGRPKPALVDQAIDDLLAAVPDQGKGKGPK